MATKAMKMRKKVVAKVIHPPFMKTNIRAQMASAAPPLGTMLGQRGLNVPNFCKEFNARTAHIKPGAVLPTRVYIKQDRTFDLEICTPMTTWLLKRACGINRMGDKLGDTCGVLSVKHIYEIAKVKSNDRALLGTPLKEICEMIIECCRWAGVKIVREDLDPVKLQAFLDERRRVVPEQLKAYADLKAAKMLRS